MMIDKFSSNKTRHIIPIFSVHISWCMKKDDRRYSIKCFILKSIVSEKREGNASTTQHIILVYNSLQSELFE